MMAIDHFTAAGHHKEVQSCTTCLANFESKAIKREHMKSDWHVYNLKRRIVSLPSISSSIFQSRTLGLVDSRDGSVEGARPLSSEPSSTKPKSKSLSIPTDSELDEGQQTLAEGNILKYVVMLTGQEIVDNIDAINPLQCLFCNLQASTLGDNVAHMSLAHSFFIPNPEYLIDNSSILSYLGFIVFSLYECLLCGCAKSSKLAIQDHMRGKNHCRVDFESEEHQLWQFYDFEENLDCDDEGPLGYSQIAAGTVLVPDDEELQLPSGKVLGHRSQRPHARHIRSNVGIASSALLSDTERALPTNADVEAVVAAPVDVRVLTTRSTLMSMVGVPESRLRALVAAERVIEKVESRARNEYQSKVESGGNKQKRFRVLTMGKKAGGLEKRLG